MTFDLEAVPGKVILRPSVVQERTSGLWVEDKSPVDRGTILAVGEPLPGAGPQVLAVGDEVLYHPHAGRDLERLDHETVRVIPQVDIWAKFRSPAHE